MTTTHLIDSETLLNCIEMADKYNRQMMAYAQQQSLTTVDSMPGQLVAALRTILNTPLPITDDLEHQ